MYLKPDIKILELLSEGFNCKEIGEIMFMSLRTIETHVHNLRVEMDAKSNVHLIKKSYERGYLKIRERDKGTYSNK